MAGLKLPRLSTPRAPKGYSIKDITLSTKPLTKLNTTKTAQEPAGDPPGDWPGTRPEWAVYWGLQANGLQPNLDFYYQSRTPGVEVSYYSTLDFTIPAYQLGIEVQGTFWHYGQGTAKIQSDVLRRAAYAGIGITVIFIDEPDALRDPKYYTEEALHYRDHSQESTQM